MSEPQFFLVLGPSGAGKSSIFDAHLGVDSLNRDKLLQQLAGHNDLARASHEAKLTAQYEEAEFIREHLEDRRSFATERTFTYATELRRLDEAKARGFETNAVFIAAGDADAHVQRAQARVLDNGHIVSEAEVRDIHEQSMRNLPLLLAAAAEGRIDNLRIYDNSDRACTVLTVEKGTVQVLGVRPPVWFREALDNTAFRPSALREALRDGTPLAELDVNGPSRRRALAAELDAVDVVVASRFAQSLSSRAVLDDMQTARERLLQGRSAQEIHSQIMRDHHRAAGSAQYAKDVLAAVIEQTGWQLPQPNQQRRDGRPEFAVRITPPQARSLIHDADAAGARGPSVEELQKETGARDVLSGRAQVGYSHTSHAFYAVLLQGSEADFRKEVAAVQADRQTLQPIRRQPYSEPDRAAAQERIAAAIEQDPEPFFEAYRALPESHDGRYICSDLFKETFPEFASSPEGRARYNNPLHNSAAVLAAGQLDRKFSEHDPVRNQAVFLTGIPGAGKTSAVKEGRGLPENVRAVYEGQLADASALAKIQGALDAGLKPVVTVVHIAPELALQNSLSRFAREGRGASLHAMARIQSELPQGLGKIRDTFGEQVQFTVVDRTAGLNNSVQQSGWHQLSKIEVGSYDDIYQRLSTALEQHHQAGTISEDAYRQARGQSTLAGSAAIDRPLDHGVEQLPQRGLAEQRRGALRFWQESNNGMTVKHAAGRLNQPGAEPFPRDLEAQRAVSRGTGYDAGHLIGHQFGGPEIPGNLSLQNHLMNQGGGTFYNLEQSWAASLAEGKAVAVHVTEYTRDQDTAFLYRKVETVTTAPSGEVTRDELLYANPESERVRRAEGRESQVQGTPGVILNLPAVPEPEPQEIGVLITDPQAQLLLADKHPQDRGAQKQDLKNALSGENPVSILDGRAELDFDVERERFYVAIREDLKPELDNRLRLLQQAQADQIKRDASRNRDEDRERD